MFSPFSYAQKPGQICHAQDAPYNYAGVWEIDTFGHPICNYWQFLDDGQRIEVENYIRSNQGNELGEQETEIRGIPSSEERDLDEGNYEEDK